MTSEIYLVAVIIGLLVHSAWSMYRHGQLITELTSKLMARDYREFAAFNAPRPTMQAMPPQRKVVNDPTLGAQY